jgi:four helix bundle protein
MARSASYRDLVAWQEAVEMVLAVYQISASFPKDEKFGLTSQLRRSAVSVPSNIAEGQGRNSKGEFLQFLGTARGSLHEVETQLLIAQKLDYGDAAAREAAFAKCDKVARLIHGLMASLRTKAAGAGGEAV